MNKDRSRFSAIVSFPDGSEETYDVTLDKKDVDLTYDEVEQAVMQAVDAKHGFTIDDYEDDEILYDIIEIVVNNEDGESYPVICEDDDDSELKKSKAYTKYLVLPAATYTLSPEAKLWMNMKESGLIDEDTDFDYEKFHKLIKDI